VSKTIFQIVSLLPAQTQNGLQSRFTVKRFFKSFLKRNKDKNGLQSRFTVKRPCLK